MRPGFSSRSRTLISGLVVASLAAAWVVGTGASPSGAAVKLGSGIGTEAAQNNPDCDKALERVKFVYQAWLPCVKPWPDNAKNGGATSPGVTATSVKVVVRKQPDAVTAASNNPIRDRATGAITDAQAAFRDSAAVFEHAYEQWGRQLEFEFMDLSGTDEAAQRADAVAALAKKPFAVIDLGAGDVFQTTIAAGKVLSLSPTTGTNKQAVEQSPYRWTAGTDTSATAVLGAEFVGKALNGKPAEFAGDSAMKTKKRVFGIVRSTANNAPQIEYVMAELEKYNVKVAEDLTYTPPLDTSTNRAVADQNAPTLIAKFKDAGVTSIIVLADATMTGALTRAASANSYNPEWISMGFGFIDIAALSRTFEQDQWSRAFGVLALYPPVKNVTAGPSDLAFQWYWGTRAGAYNQAIFTQLEILYAGMHMAGPKLTPETFKEGMFARPPTGGAAEGKVTDTARLYGKKANLPYDEYLTGGDVTLAWWDAKTVGPSVSVAIADAAGVWQFVDGAKRYVKGDLPSKMPPFFDATKGLNVFPAVPSTDTPPSYPCVGCPSATPTA